MEKNKDTIEKVVSYVRQFYKIEELLTTYGITMPEGDSPSISINCPFHSDRTPSFSLNRNNQIYCCFSCGSKGNYISLLTDLKSEKEGSKLGYYKVMDNLLKADREMQNTIGASTIYIKDNSLIVRGEVKPVKVINPKFTVKEDLQKPSTYLELANLMKAKGITSIEDIMRAVLLVQSDFGVKDVYNELFDINLSSLEFSPLSDYYSSSEDSEGGDSVRSLLESITGYND